MKTINIIGVVILAPLAAVLFAFAVGFKTLQVITEHILSSERQIKTESITVTH